ncbi:stress up-regulated Nod 19 protein [Trifolium repens]|nr:stress up-regulated Nod 19 protein [Trifolium repens]
MSVSPCSSADSGNTENNVKTTVYLTPKIELSPGFISNKIYYDVEFPKGHVALKSFQAELVDESGNSVPLQQTYLHHWIVLKYRQPKNVTNKNNQTGIIIERNSGVCQGYAVDESFGRGAETRGTNPYIPDPYGIEIGNPSNIQEGYDEKWIINVLAIDTRGVEDKMGCIECKCDLYNHTSINAFTGGRLLACTRLVGLPPWESNVNRRMNNLMMHRLCLIISFFSFSFHHLCPFSTTHFISLPQVFSFSFNSFLSSC